MHACYSFQICHELFFCETDINFPEIYLVYTLCENDLLFNRYTETEPLNKNKSFLQNDLDPISLSYNLFNIREDHILLGGK